MNKTSNKFKENIIGNKIMNFYKNDGTECDMDCCDYCRIALKKYKLKTGDMLIANDDICMLISKSSIEIVSCFEWYFGKDGYPVAYNYVDDKKRCGGWGIKIHRLLMKDPEGMVVDHINGDRLDNRIENLRICTAKENSYNTKRRTDHFKGVKKISEGNYTASISKDNIVTKIKNIPTEKEAAEMYDILAEDAFGKFAGKNYKKIYE